MSDRVLRTRQNQQNEALDRASVPMPACAMSMVVQTTNDSGHYPIVAAAYYACHPILLSGDESEGAAATFSGDTNTVIYAMNLGTSIPPDHTYVIIHGGSGKWCFTFNG